MDSLFVLFLILGMGISAFICLFVFQTDSTFLMAIIATVIAFIMDSIYKKAIDKRNLPYVFYSECLSNGILDIKDSLQRQKAILIAQKNGCKFNDIEVYYNKAKKFYISKNQSDAQLKEKAAYEEMRSKEIQAANGLTKYSSYYGRDKRVAILTDEYQYCAAKAKSNKRMAANAPNVLLEKEKDWATHAGIANGLAGGAAAVCVAAEIEQENAQIRERNQSRMPMVSRAQSNLRQSAESYEDKSKYLWKQLERAKIALVESGSEKALFEGLKIVTKKVSISETGAVYVDSEITNSKAYKIGEFEAVVDGVINAKIYQKNKMIGNSLLTLPTFGIKYNQKIQLEGISLINAEKGVPCEIVYEPHRLWIIEK